MHVRPIELLFQPFESAKDAGVTTNLRVVHFVQEALPDLAVIWNNNATLVEKQPMPPILGVIGWVYG